MIILIFYAVMYHTCELQRMNSVFMKFAHHTVMAYGKKLM